MRILILTVLATGLAVLPAVQADAPAKARVMGQATVTDGQSLDWPNCLEGEIPGVEYHRPQSNRYLVGGVEVRSGPGTWTFHIQAFSAERHNPLSGDDLKQVQLPVTIYCKPNGS